MNWSELANEGGDEQEGTGLLLFSLFFLLLLLRLFSCSVVGGPLLCFALLRVGIRRSSGSLDGSVASQGAGSRFLSREPRGHNGRSEPQLAPQRKTIPRSLNLWCFVSQSSLLPTVFNGDQRNVSERNLNIRSQCL